MGIDFSEKGQPAVDREACTQCGQCIDICPDNVLESDNGYPRPGDGEFAGCVACGHCMAICPTGAITVSGRGLMGNDAVELAPHAARATAEQLEALMASRRSIRRFTEREVDRELLERMLAMAATAPMGIPPHEVGVVVFATRERVRHFTDLASEAFARTVKFCNPVTLTLMRPMLGGKLCRMLRDFVKPLLKTILAHRAKGGDRFIYEAPAAMLFHHTPIAAVEDCAIVATYAMLAAESLGLGTCMLGTTAAINQHKDIKQKLGVPPENGVGVALGIGHPDVEFQRGVRRQLASVRYA